MYMIEIKSPNDIFLELRETTECLFGLHLENPIPINLGLFKFKMESSNGKRAIFN